MKKGKRYLSLFLAFAMVITGINLGTLMPVQAGEVKKSEVYYQTVTGVSYGNQVQKKGAATVLKDGTAGGQVTYGGSDHIADSKLVGGKDNVMGNVNQAPFTSYSVDTSNSGGDLGPCGAQRNGCIVFDMSDKPEMDLTGLTGEDKKKATVSLHLTDVSNTRGNNSKWYRVALYETANSKGIDPADDSTYAAREYVTASDGNPHSGTAIWSDQTVSQNETGDKGEVKKTGNITFDVTDVFKKAYEKGDRYIVYRVQVPRGGITFDASTLTIDATIPTQVAVNYVDEDGDKIQESKQVDTFVGSTYEYDVADDEKILTTETGVYIYQKTENSSMVVSADDGAAINLVYKKVVPQSVANPEKIYVINGNTPILPKQLTATTDIDDVTVPVDIVWEDISAKEWEVGKDNTVTGTAKGLKGDAANVTATVHIYECDEAIDGEITADTNNSTSAVRKLSGKYKGKIITEFDIIPLTKGADDCAFIYYDTDNVTNLWNGGGAMLHFTWSKGFFNLRSGNGDGKDAPNDPASNGKAIFDGKSVYHVRMEMDTTGGSPGSYRAYITDPDGNVNEVGTKANGFRTYDKGVIQTYYAGRYGEFKVANHKISWQSGYAWARVDYVTKGDNGIVTPLDGVESIITKELPGDKKSMKDETFATPMSLGGKMYLYNAEASGWDMNGDGVIDENAGVGVEVTMPEAGKTAVFKAVYEAATLVSPDEAVEVTTLTGKAPLLPEKVKAKYKGVGDPILTEVEWDTENLDITTETKDGEPRTVTGTFPDGKTVTAKVNVKHAYLMASYKFEAGAEKQDSAPKNVDASYSTKSHADATPTNTESADGVDAGSKGVKLKGTGNGTSNVKLPNDLLQITGADRTTKITQDDFTVSMFINRKSVGNSFAMILHATHLNKGDPGPAGHLGLINKNSQLDMEYRIGGSTKNKLQAKNEKGQLIITPVDEWTHIAIVTNGSNDTAKLYLDGVKVDEITGIVKPSELAAQNNYLGRASWNNQDYPATFDDFEVYNGLLTEEEIQNIANERLCKAPVDDICKNLKLALEEGELGDDTLLTEASKLVLPATMKTSAGKTISRLTITWESSDEELIGTDGKIEQPSKGEGNKPVKLTATVKYGSYSNTKEFNVTVKEGEKINFKPLAKKREEAEKIYASADKSNAYHKDVLDALDKEITDAKAVEATETTEETATYEAVRGAISKLQAAIDGLKAGLKTFEEINAKEILAAWYPLDNAVEKAADKSGNGHNGTAADSVTFSKENGATFTGGTAQTALQNCIILPTDFEVQEQMTFAFWAKDERAKNDAGKSNAFGIGSGDGFGATDKKDAHFFYVNTNDGGNLVASMNPKYWSGATNITTAAAAKDVWHHITCVLNGTELTLYKDGVLVESKDVGATVKAMWTADEATQHFYIGNCVYAKNPSNSGNDRDPDYKGSIRDFRVYNAALAAEQVQKVYGYKDSVLPMKYAKEDLIASVPGAKVMNDGTVTLSISNESHPNGTINLPATSYGGAKVEWASSDPNTINVDTKEVKIPENGQPQKSVNLTATIKIGEGEAQKTENVVFKCTVFFKKDIPTGDLETALEKVQDKIKNNTLVQGNYTTGSWKKLMDAIDTAVQQIDNPNSADDVAAAKTGLENAERDLVDISGLRSKYNTLNAEFGKLTETDYSKASWDALKSKLEAAKAVLDNANATAGQVQEQLNALPEKAAPELKACGSKAKLEKAIADAQELRSYMDAYTTDSWAKFTTALNNANSAMGQRLEDYDTVADALTAAVNALVIAQGHELGEADKQTYTAELNAARAEALVSGNYTKETWDEYQKALDNLAAAIAREKATKDEAQAASAALKEKRDALVPTDAQKPEQTDKNNLAAAIAGAIADTSSGNYTEESWNAYKAAKDALDKLSKKLEKENNNVAKGEIEKAVENLETAEKALVPTTEQELTDTDKADLTAAVADAKASLNNYTEESRKDYEAALAELEALGTKANATKAEVEAAKAKLAEAEKALIPTTEQELTDADKTDITETVADANTLILDNYTEESRKLYQAALAELEALSTKPNATKAEVEAAKAKLAEAKEALRPTEEHAPTAEEKTAFTSASTAAKEEMAGKNASDYTAESWARYEAAVAAMEKIAANIDSATKEQIDAAAQEYDAAKAALASAATVDKTDLNKAVEAAKKLKEKTYTPSTWKNFQEALEAADAVAEKSDATQQEVDDALKALEAKQKALKKAVTSITITDKATDSKTIKIAAGKKVTLKATAAPKDASSSVTWSVDSKSKNLATVNKKTGVVTIKKNAGGKKVSIIATAKDGSKKTQKVTITVMKNAVTKVTLKAAKKVKAGRAVTIKATVKTNGKKANKAVFWSIDSKSAKYASINSKGKLSTKKTGAGKKVTVTATSTDGTNKKAKVTITLTK